MDESNNKTVNPQMLFKKTLQKTKNFLHKTPHNLKSFLFGGSHKLPKARNFNRFFSSSKRISKSSTFKELDDLYRDYYQQRHQTVHNEIQRNTSIRSSIRYQGMVEGEGTESQSKIAVCLGGRKEEDKMDTYDEEKRGKVFTRSTTKGDIYDEEKKRKMFSRSTSKGDPVLEQKMKELEMMEGGDLDHVLDIEEVLHCYSLLNSPVYQDIVDRFFMDMYTEFSVPKQPPRSVHSSMRSLGLLKL